MDRSNLHHHPHAPYNRNLTLPPLPSPAFQGAQNPFPPLLTQRPAPYNAHLHPVPSPSQLDPIHPPPSSNWRRDDKREFPPIESGNGSGYGSYSGYPSRRDTYADSRSSSSRVVPTVADVPKDVDDNMPPTSDFVKKLYKMLEDPQFSHVVTWGPQGDCFVVKDVTEFTKSILPRMFKHSNFASFVRQLNKYDFHKLKNAEAEAGGMGYGDQSWTFKHPDFRADDRDALENIKRKVPAVRKSKSGPAPTPASAPPAQPNGTKTEAASPAPDVAASPSGSGVEPSREGDTIRMLLAQVEAMRASQEATRRAHEEQIEGLRRTAEDMSAHIRNLETNYQNVLGEIVHFQRNMANQDNLMQNLIGYFIGMENKKTSNATGDAPPPDSNDPQHQFMNGPEASKIFDLGPQDVARASFEQMNEISRRAERSSMSFTDNSGMSGTQGGSAQNMTGGGMSSANMGPSNPGNMSGGPPQMNSGVGTSMNPGVSGATMINGKPVQAMTREEVLGRVEDLQRERPDQPFTHSNFMPMLNGPLMDRQRQEEEAHKGLQVITLGHLVPRDGTQNQQGGMGNGMDYQQNQHHQQQPQSAQQQQQMHGQDMMGSYSPPANYHGPTPSSSSGAGTSTPGGGKSLRVRRSTYVPGWAVPPRVLLVDDDAVNLRLSKKFLQVFGCTIDVAVDGVGAVDKMNLEKYDLVLMDIVMPKMDGVSATSLIRRFDHMTPIISMTSNSKPNEIMTYYSSGMNDILPKPFSKEGLFEMLEKHLMHLKQIHQLGQFPRGVSIPPMNDSHMIDYIQHHNNAEASSSNSHAVGFANGTKTPNGVFNGFGPYDDDSGDPGKVEPFAALGLTEESYRMLMGDMITQEGSGFFGDSGMDGAGRVKRGVEDDSEDGGGKRPRFEEIVD